MVLRIVLRPSLVPLTIPPLPLPLHLHVSEAVDPTLGDAGTYLKFPRSRLPHTALVKVSQTTAST